MIQIYQYNHSDGHCEHHRHTIDLFYFPTPAALIHSSIFFLLIKKKKIDCELTQKNKTNLIYVSTRSYKELNTQL